MKHPMKRTRIVEYPDTFVKLTNDKDAYSELFAPYFGYEIQDLDRRELNFDLVRKSFSLRTAKFTTSKLYPI